MKPQGWEWVVRDLREGRPAIFPTDTVYGLGVAVAWAADPQELFRLKGRPAGKPVAWLVEGPEALDRYGVQVSDEARRLARQGWPGALTIIVRASDAVPAAFQSAQGTIGLRVADSSLVRQLVQETGSPLAVTSANRAGEPAPVVAADLDPALRAKVSAILQDDPMPSGRPSTVVDCSRSAAVILRD